MRRPKEDPRDRAARLRERRMAEVEQQGAAQDQAGRLASDLRAIYGYSMFGGPRPQAVKDLGLTRKQ